MSAVVDESLERADAQRMLSEVVDKFVTRATTLNRVRELRGKQPGFDRHLWKTLADQGWLGVHVPEEYGGQGLGFTELSIVAERLGGALIPEPFTPCAVLATSALLHGDNQALKKKLLPQMVEGKLIVALAWQEGLKGTELKAEVKSTKNSQGFLLNGSKRFVTPAAGADAYIVTADNGMYYLLASTTGIETKLEKRADGTFSGLLSFKDVQVGTDAVVATGAGAAVTLRRAVDEAAIIAGAELHGLMSNALELTIGYMKTRVQFGKLIGSFQALQHRAVDVWIQKELSRAIVSHAVRQLDLGITPEELSELASRVKSRCSDAGLELCRDCIRLHGAIGYTDEYDAGMYMQRALVLSAWLGNGAEHRRRYDAMRSEQRDAEAEALAELKKTKPANLPGSLGDRPADTDWNALTDEEFRLEAYAFYEKHFPKHLRHSLRHHVEIGEIEGYMKTASGHGWLAPPWPKRWSGMGLSPAKQLIVMEERSRVGVMRVMEQGVNQLGPVLMKFGTEAQKAHYLPKILSVEHVWCQGYSEPNAGSDLASLQMRAVLDGDHYVLNGSKIWTSSANEANHIYVLARTNSDPNIKRQAGISFFLVDMKTPGLTVRPIETLAGETHFCQVFFDDVRVPVKDMVGEPNQGWTVAKGLMGFERLTTGSPRRLQYPLTKLKSVAKARGMWDDAEFRSKYTKLELDVRDLGAIWQTYADAIIAGGHPSPGISMLKIWTSETYMRLNMLLMETAGSAGSLRDAQEYGSDTVDVLGCFYPLFPATISAGTNDIQRNVLAKRVLDLP